jgi:hypothetical protein
MMKKAVILILTAILFHGCSLVTVKKPIGEKSPNINILAWEGIWYDGDNSVLFIKVKDKKNSVLYVRAVENSSDTLKIKEFDVILRKGTKMLFANIPFKEIAEKKELNSRNRDCYIWGAVKNQNNRIIFFSPDGKEFRDLIDEGKLNGVAENGYIHLSSSVKAVIELCESERSGRMFDWENPVIFRKLK